MGIIVCLMYIYVYKVLLCFANFVRLFMSQNSSLNVPLQDDDKEIYDLIQKEKYRQYSGLELIASEV